eukprot:800824-Amphidinium_carterae.1
MPASQFKMPVLPADKQKTSANARPRLLDLPDGLQESRASSRNTARRWQWNTVATKNITSVIPKN